jgi:hypothetical protein
LQLLTNFEENEENSLVRKLHQAPEREKFSNKRRNLEHNNVDL